MITKLNTAQAAITNALTGQLFDRPEAAGGQRELIYYLGELPGKREDEAQGQDVPFCLLQPGAFELSQTGTKQAVTATLSLYSAGTRTQGLSMVSDTIKKLQGITSKQHTPCKLMGDIVGDPVEIDHPYYSITFTINLKTI